MSDYAVAVTGSERVLYQRDTGEDTGYLEVEWDDTIARQAIIDLGSRYAWSQIFPGEELPQEIIDAENAEIPGAQGDG